VTKLSEIEQGNEGFRAEQSRAEPSQ